MSSQFERCKSAEHSYYDFDRRYDRVLTLD